LNPASALMLQLIGGEDFHAPVIAVTRGNVMWFST
jgi:hypothetical protein